jgi:lysophospholipase L1-like esterase
MASTNPRTSSAPLSPGAKALGLFLAALALALVGFLYVVLPAPPSLVADEGQAHVSFAADRASALVPGDCVTVRWEVGGIRTVTINGRPTVGTGDQEICVTTAPESMPALRVRLQDGELREYPLNISIVARKPEVWFLGVLAVLALLASGYVVTASIFGSRLSMLRPYWRGAVRLIQISALVLVIGTVGLELVLRFYFSDFGTERERVMYLSSAKEIEGQTGYFLPMPNVTYVASPGYPGHNRLGYRGPEVAIPKPPGIFRIVAVGGSTTYGIATDWEDAYPAQLQNMLRDDYGYTNVEVVNAGVSGYNSWDILANFEFRVSELEPDLIIFYEAINDVPSRAVAPDCYQGLNAARGLNPARGLWHRPLIPIESALYRLVAIHFGWMADPSILDNIFDPQPIQCSDEIGGDPRIADNPPVYFERNVRNLILVAQGNGVQVMLSTWTYNQNAEEQALSPERRAAVEEHNEIIRGLAEEYHLPLYDLAATDFWQNPDYWVTVDAVHMTAPGTHEQAQRYADFLVGQGLIPTPTG